MIGLENRLCTAQGYAQLRDYVQLRDMQNLSRIARNATNRP